MSFSHRRILFHVSFAFLVFANAAVSRAQNILAATEPAYGQHVPASSDSASEFEIVSPVPGTSLFGSSMAIVDDLLVVSAALEDIDGMNWVGAVYVYRRSAYGTFDLEVRLTAEEEAEEGALFGTSVAAESYGDSTVVIVGSSLGVFVFVNVEQQWSRMQHLVGSSAQLGFGGAVSIDGRVLAVAASSTAPSGAIVIFELTVDGFVEVDVVATSDSIHFLGRPVHVDGNRIASGTRGFEDYFGKFYSFNRNDDGWYQEALLDTPSSIRVSAPMSLDDDYIAVRSHDDSSSVYVYGFDGNSWQELSRIPEPSPEAVRFGATVHFTDDFLLIGAPSDSEFGQATGAVYVYERDSWTLRAKISSSNPQPLRSFGDKAVVSNGSTVVVGTNSRPESIFVLDLSAILIRDTVVTPSDMAIESVFPNPFTTRVTISYEISRSGSTTVTVIDILGRTVSVLVDEYREPGFYETVWRPGQHAAGRYLVLLRSGGAVRSMHVLLSR